jgi:ribonucleoside-diphosphate reductase alpha chain
MGILRVDHPDILEFISCKDDTSKVTNFNISVAVTDAFMAAVAAGEDYALIHPRSGAVVDRLSAREVFAKIIHGAWKTGEPGVFFIDQANRHNPVPHLGGYEATNPCGEQPLLPYDVCNLGSINVGVFAHNGEVDWDGLGRAVHLCTHFLDNVIDVNKYPLPQITRLAQRIRRVGLGIMGWADFLIRIGVPYNSKEAVGWARKLMAFVDEEAKVESERLAFNRGVFPEWKRSIWGPDETCARNAHGDRIRPQRRLRNCNLTTVAPTGTISILAGCSSGIEPLFAVAFQRRQADTLMTEVNEDFVAIARQEGWFADGLTERIAEAGHIHFDDVPRKWQDVFVTAHDVAPEWHIEMQAAFQEFTDSAISKTCNFPRDASEDYVREIYERAHRLGCKGVTVYRDGSRDMQVLATGDTAKKAAGREGTGGSDRRPDDEITELRATVAELEAELARTKKQLHEIEAENLQRRAKRSRPELLKGSTRRVETPLGTLYVTITEDDKGQPFEMFMTLGKAGGALMADVEAVGRLISLALRSGIPMHEVHRQLRGISSDRVTGLGPNKVLSVPDAIGIAMEKWMQDKQGIQQELLDVTSNSSDAIVTVGRRDAAGADGSLWQVEAYNTKRLVGACPDCGSQLEYAEGCAKCHVCGFSECG